MAKKSSSKVGSMVNLTCPKCREGKLFVDPNPYRFKTMTKMRESCPNCGQDFTIEPGFYFGATYISYALNVAWLVPTFVAGVFLFDASFWGYVVFMLAMLPILTPPIYRLSRSIWLHMFVGKASS
ncbi:DUF983 domain-containing protein [Pontibacter sp. G13]|uniref:DUF983 domain-containing protein n=1 Tax=Pontibacter sp. G13 TaxID=3074898 RepID=UPI00288B67AE|nr:DUF983 domain-containing protein [Pontibacter sp. G13]WNJ20420.1 DUF983 domain-containing protein [Pontibacter sp. G13]